MVTRVKGRVNIYILLIASRLINAVTVAPVTRVVMRKKIVCAFLTVFTIVKYPSALITIGVAVVSELYLSGEKSADIKTANVKIITGISRGVRLICTFFSTTAFTPIRIIVTRVTNAMSICLGKINISVVRVRKNKGKLKKNIPQRNNERFSK